MKVTIALKADRLHPDRSVAPFTRSDVTNLKIGTAIEVTWYDSASGKDVTRGYPLANVEYYEVEK